jgi:hypothetical protein
MTMTPHRLVPGVMLAFLAGCTCTPRTSVELDAGAPCVPTAEQCNGLDDDCNGLVDDLPLEHCGVGACAVAQQTCQAGATVACVPGKPGTELCNGLDDDCNGQVDDGLGTTSCGTGACARTAPACVDGHPGTCTAGEPTAETCNGLDDDCNGHVDDGLAQLSCGVGACARVVAACLDSSAQQCVPGTAEVEVCNGLDDDCNGQIDDGVAPVTCGVGVCARTVPACDQGEPAVCTPGTAVPETCNGLDDNCNGTVDEGLLTNTSGDLRLTHDPAASDYVYLGATDGGFGLTWQDRRDGAAQNGEIYVTLLDHQGNRRSATDTRVTTTTGFSIHPAMAASPTGWGLVYADDTVGNLELYFQALDLSGTPVGAAVRLTQAAGDSDWPDVVWTGTDFVVAWEDARLGAQKQDLYVLRVDATGQPLGTEVQVTTDPARQSSPILKWNGTEFGLSWTDYRAAGNREIYFERLDATLKPQGELRVTNDPADSAWSDLAWNDVDHEWALVWHDTRDGNDEIYFARLDATGVKQGVDTRLTNDPGTSMYPSIDWNGFQYGVSWQDDRVTGKTGIYFAQVSAQGVKNGADLKLSSGGGNSTYTTALWNGSTFAFCWRDDRDAPTGNTELYFAYVGCPTP